MATDIGIFHSGLSAGNAFFDAAYSACLPAIVGRDRLIRALGIFGTVANVMVPAVYVGLLYRMQHELHFSSSVAGIVMAGYGIGYLLGSSFNSILVRKLETHRILVMVMIIQVIPPLLLANTHSWGAFLVAYTLEGLSFSVWNVNVLSMRQALIPDHLMGRAMTSIRLVSWAGLPVGNSLGGMIVQALGSTFILSVVVTGRFIVLLRGSQIFRNTNMETGDSQVA